MEHSSNLSSPVLVVSSSPSSTCVNPEPVSSDAPNDHHDGSQQPENDGNINEPPADLQGPPRGCISSIMETLRDRAEPVEEKKATKGWLGTEVCIKYLLRVCENTPYNGSGGIHTRQVSRSLRRSRLMRRGLIRRQFDRGRGNPSVNWCNKEQCDYEFTIFTNPTLYLGNRPKSSQGLHADVYFHDFADAMVTKLFAPEDSKAKRRKALEILSFVDSPPVRVAFSHFVEWYNLLGFTLSDRQFSRALAAVQPVFQGLMFGVKTAARVDAIHEYILPETEDMKQWAPSQLILRFLVWCEIWRQQKTSRSESWKLGSTRTATEFLTAMLLNYKMMWREGCLQTSTIETNLVWDRVWDSWLRKYSLQEIDEVVNGEFFYPRDQLDMSEEEVYQEVGYLGGPGHAVREIQATRRSESNLQVTGKVYPKSRIAELRNSFAFSYWKAKFIPLAKKPCLGRCFVWILR
ncbi:Histone-lysine N-methyltransferase, H3 lysine-9 specific dim-5 [Fusarium agapanthi]|uniref:Histone-lysine N-methyltransferase, H3 lysine-9 specific dim-5 n=1 Tax=Fusarium agapanthi TaxID=1803897 RepID=A0A9P5E3Z9_9HYPO|nr:Histone-lysine N-methyltransferase, H3 lysine-9 specific dim-5 [Fusarium agapanthi]